MNSSGTRNNRGDKIIGEKNGFDMDYFAYTLDHLREAAAEAV